MEDYHLPICTKCYAVRVEPHRRHHKRPVCMSCAEILSREVKRTIVPLNKGHYFPCTDASMLKQLNPKRT
jgi:transposase-like protein